MLNRRNFIKTGILATLAARMGIGEAFASTPLKKGTVLGFEGPVTSEKGTAGPDDLSVFFLGSGASGWTNPDCGRRRHSSVILDGKVLIDLTFSAEDIFPSDCHPEIIFYTHSHGDHFDPETALKHGIKKVYIHESWIERGRRRFEEASAGTALAMPEIIPLVIGDKVSVEGLEITAMPANHATGDVREQAVIYLVEKGTTAERLGVRLFYATDTGNILQSAAKIAGIDPLMKNGRPITAFIMEGTIPPTQEVDYRIFSHTTIEGVGRIVNTLIENGRYLPPQGQPAYLTHMSTKNFPPHDELNKVIPWPLRAACDGLTVIFRAQ